MKSLTSETCLLMEIVAGSRHFIAEAKRVWEDVEQKLTSILTDEDCRVYFPTVEEAVKPTIQQNLNPVFLSSKKMKGSISSGNRTNYLLACSRRELPTSYD